MGKVTFKNSDTVIKFKDGRPDLTPANLTDEIYHKLVSKNKYYEKFFNVEGEPVKESKKQKSEVTA